VPRKQNARHKLLHDRHSHLILPYFILGRCLDYLFSDLDICSSPVKQMFYPQAAHFPRCCNGNVIRDPCTQPLSVKKCSTISSALFSLPANDKKGTMGVCGRKGGQVSEQFSIIIKRKVGQAIMIPIILMMALTSSNTITIAASGETT
jgi:hypothetical protein